MARVGRPPTCECGVCGKCQNRRRNRERYQATSPDERRAWVARRDSEKVRAADLRRSAKPERQEYLNAASRLYSQRNPKKRAARIAVGNAIAAGRLERGACEHAGDGMCSGPVQAHHEDYSRPLDVRWLCREHHWAEHKALSHAL